MTIPPHSVRVDSGKYTFIKRADDKGLRIEILRGGEPWHEQSLAFNAIASTMAELDAARVVLSATRYAIKTWPATPERGLLEIAVAAHDSLVSDGEPPSAWCANPGQPTPRAPEPAASGGPKPPRYHWTWTRDGVSLCPRHGTTFDTSSEPCWQCKGEADNEAARKPAANERQPLPITRWSTTEPRADAIAGSEVLIDGHRHTIEGDCCARTACLACAGTNSCGSHLIRHRQFVVGGTASICERCPDDAHRWKAREASNEARQPPSAVHPASVYPAALELLAQRARQWAAAERLADERAAALETTTETLAKPDTHDWLDNVHRYACAQAGVRVAGKVADDTLDWLKEAAMALLTEGE